MRYQVIITASVDIEATTDRKAQERANLLAKAVDLKWMEKQDWVVSAGIEDVIIAEINPHI